VVTEVKLLQLFSCHSKHTRELIVVARRFCVSFMECWTFTTPTRLEKSTLLWSQQVF